MATVSLNLKRSLSKDDSRGRRPENWRQHVPTPVKQPLGLQLSDTSLGRLANTLQVPAPIGLLVIVALCPQYPPMLLSDGGADPGGFRPGVKHPVLRRISGLLSRLGDDLNDKLGNVRACPHDVPRRSGSREAHR